VTRHLENNLRAVVDSGAAEELAHIRRGIEKESLRVSPDGVLADTPHPEALGSALDARVDQVRAELVDAARYLKEQYGSDAAEIAVIGFSLGAFYALDLSAAVAEHVRSVVIFYGTGPADFSKSRAEYLGHFAEDDAFEPPANGRAV